MFVRLFVDENLDRMVPISKQPKDKIQAILDACDRQFPEYHERSRKRIRTYLKSCRRMRRSKENGWESVSNLFNIKTTFYFYNIFLWNIKGKEMLWSKSRKVKLIKHRSCQIRGSYDSTFISCFVISWCEFSSRQYCYLSWFKAAYCIRICWSCSKC